MFPVLDLAYNDILTSISTIHAAKTVWDAIRGAVSISIEKKPAMFLSGGLDTGLIGAACKELQYRPVAYTVSFPYTHESIVDWENAKLIADHVGVIWISHTMYEENVHQAREGLQKIIGSQIPRGTEQLWFIYEKLAVSGAKYVMGGHGGDELFGGYTWKYDVPEGKVRKKMEVLWHTNLFNLLYVEREIAEHFGVTLLTPLLDPMVVGIALRLPLRLLYDANSDLKEAVGGKVLLRYLAKTKLPKGVSQMKKIGFTLPEEWS